MEPRPGRLPELEATRPHMEPKASCPTAAPLVERKFHVLVGVTGSVAALKLPLLVSKLLDIPGVSILTRQAWQPPAWEASAPGDGPLFCSGCNFLFLYHVNHACGGPVCVVLCGGFGRQRPVSSVTRG